MKAMAGKANPQIVNERLRAKLGYDCPTGVLRQPFMRTADSALPQ